MMQSTYPASVLEVLDDAMQFHEATVAAVHRFAASKPWHGSISARKKKFRILNQDLSAAYEIEEPDLHFGLIDGSSSGASHYISLAHRIVLVGKLSVVTLLHEFAHARGMGEQDACRWSINLFRRCFPRQFSRLIFVGHTLVRPADVASKLARRRAS
jgi:hypothetical protein